MTATTDTQQPDTDNLHFQRAVAFVKETGENLFLTGKAGTGKTTFLKYIRDKSGKQCAVVAPTGVAAMNAGGETIHSFLQLPLGPFVPGSGGGFGRKAEGAEDKHSLLANLKLREAKLKLIKKLDLLIVDEVSMVRADVMDAMDTVLRHVRERRNIPFGGVQMLFIGDIFQLPPVAREEDWSILGQFYSSPHFFDAQVLRQHPPVYIELKKVFRQKEQTFVDLLNRVRNGEPTASDISLLNERYSTEMPRNEGHIVLCSHNYIAEDINRKELANIDAHLHKFEGKITGEVNTKSLPAEHELHLKKGAQVMFIKNDLQSPRRYYNGRIGVVTEISAEGIKVEPSGGGAAIDVAQETWRNVRYTLDKTSGNVTEEEKGSFTQYPLKLAWAVTVHKSQGLTLEKVILDVNRSFAPGQVYVALSRCTTLSGIVMRDRINAASIITDERVLSFAANEMDENELDELLEASRLKQLLTQLQSVFFFTELITYITGLRKELDKRKTGPREENLATQAYLFDTLVAAQVHAARFGEQLALLVPRGDTKALEERLQAAVAYFSAHTFMPCLERVAAHKKLLEQFPKVAKQNKLWREAEMAIRAKVTEMGSALAIPGHSQQNGN
ncbi:MAG: AAA family ATPase [Taibaiella sp.]|nr:AAA family ATPase [Taibaiella sp.]